MGGTNPVTINNQRLHLNNGEVHLHDDAKNLKFQMPQAEFKTAMQSALTELSGGDGVVAIPGSTPTILCVGRLEGKTFTFLRDDKDSLADLQSFISQC